MSQTKGATLQEIRSEIATKLKDPDFQYHQSAAAAFLNVIQRQLGEVQISLIYAAMHLTRDVEKSREALADQLPPGSLT